MRVRCPGGVRRHRVRSACAAGVCVRFCCARCGSHPPRGCAGPGVAWGKKPGTAQGAQAAASLGRACAPPPFARAAGVRRWQRVPRACPGRAGARSPWQRPRVLELAAARGTWAAAHANPGALRRAWAMPGACGVGLLCAVLFHGALAARAAARPPASASPPGAGGLLSDIRERLARIQGGGDDAAQRRRLEAAGGRSLAEGVLAEAWHADMAQAGHPTLCLPRAAAFVVAGAGGGGKSPRASRSLALRRRLPAPYAGLPRRLALGGWWPARNLPRLARYFRCARQGVLCVPPTNYAGLCGAADVSKARAGLRSRV